MQINGGLSDELRIVGDTWLPPPGPSFQMIRRFYRGGFFSPTKQGQCSEPTCDGDKRNVLVQPNVLYFSSSKRVADE